MAGRASANVAIAFPAYLWLQFVLCVLAVAAGLVIVAGGWLPFLGRHIAHHMGWYGSFVGTFFVAFVTSLPELVVTLAALRLGALDMALGNLMGGNPFNVVISAIDDIFYTAGALLSDVTVTHFASAFSAVSMSSLAIIGLHYRINHRELKTVGWISLLLISVDSLNAVVLYKYGS